MAIGPVEQSIDQRRVELEHDRERRLARAWRHFSGDTPRRLDVGEDGVDDNVRLNLAELIVSTATTYLYGAERELSFEVEGDTQEDRLAELIDEVWDPDTRSIQLGHIGINGGVTGDVFVRLTLEGRVIVLDPSNVTVDWDEDDIEHVLEYRNTWTTTDAVTGNVEARRQRVTLEGETWVIRDERSASGSGSWELLEEDNWPFPWCPVLHAQHRPAPNEFHGRAQLEGDILDLIEGIEQLAGSMKRLVRFHGKPIPWVTGSSAKDLGIVSGQAGRFLAIPNTDARVGQLELSGDLGAALVLFDKLVSKLHQLTKVPEVATGKLDNVGQLSGLALSILYGPLVELIGELRTTHGPLVGAIAGRLLELNGAGETRVTVQFPRVLPHDVQGETQALEADLRMGVVSKETVAEKRGYDWMQERERMDQEAEAGANRMAAAMNAGMIGRGSPGDDDENAPPRGFPPAA